MAKKLEPTILYEDDQMLAINKPAGLVVHYNGKTEEPSVVDWILKKYPELKEVGEPITLSTGEIIYRPGIVHRLDRETSGVLLIAKTSSAFEFLKEEFKERRVRKTYNAFVYGVFNEYEAKITKPIGRSKNDFRQWAVGREARGEMRDAETEYTVLEKGKVEGDGFSYVEVKPKTGRTHQIRVHFKSIHYPVVADRLYAPNRKTALGFKRLALHAHTIELDTPGREHITIEAPLPADFKKALKTLKAAEVAN
jgi:23S rRNA pseudouridine1911/1915/1917 synthase